MQIPISFNLVSLFLLLSFIFLITSYKWQKSKPKNHHQKLPPSPWNLPLIGHLHHILGSLPHHSFANLSKNYGPLIHLKLGEVSTILVSSPSIAKEVLKNLDPIFADRPEAQAYKIMWKNQMDIAFCPYGEYWRQMRKICVMELLSSKNIRSFESIRVDEVSHLVQSIRSSSQQGRLINLSEKISFSISSITCRAAFGKVCKDPHTLIMVLRKAVALASGFGFADFYPSSKLINLISWNKFKLLSMRRKIDSVLEDIINEHCENSAKSNGESGDEDLVDVLLRLKNGKKLEFPITNENIRAILFDMFSAGTETTSTTLDWAMVELVKNPLVMAKAQNEIRQAFKDKKRIDESDIPAVKYLKLVIKETLRLHPPIALIPRACREECEVNGYKIPSKTKVMINVWDIGRNPDYWPNPTSFIPERFENNLIDFLGAHFEYLPFGSGKRFCPGMAFALVNVELYLAQLLYHFDWKLPQGTNSEDLDMAEVEGLAISRKQQLYLVAQPYTNPPIVD